MAYGVISAAEEYGLSIPRDIALVGFDDDTPSAHVYPPLTTVRQPYYEMGEQGLKLLLSLLDTPPNNFSNPTRSASQAGEEMPPARILLQTTLVVRASCGADFQIVSIPQAGRD
jgi:LacI family transcriptional regulator